LERVPDGAVVAVHDGVRPLVSVDLVRSMFSKAETVPALIPVLPCVDTMKVLSKTVLEDGSEELTVIPGHSADRSVLYGAQTPQIFHSEILKAAYRQAFDTAFTDDASVVEALGEKVSGVEGNRENIKITTPFDMLVAKTLMECLTSQQEI
jgi:2-C-methyl-D-erythritol 4-phosphate cytidylyltransferase